jgi:hypothetical protein
VEGPYEHGDEPSGSIKCWEILEWLRNWRLLKKGSQSVPWSWLVSLVFGSLSKVCLLLGQWELMCKGKVKLPLCLTN